MFSFNMTVTSAYRTTLQVNVSAISFIYNEKRIGPKMLPCGTPYVMTNVKGGGV